MVVEVHREVAAGVDDDAAASAVLEDINCRGLLVGRRERLGQSRVGGRRPADGHIGRALGERLNAVRVRIRPHIASRRVLLERTLLGDSCVSGIVVQCNHAVHRRLDVAVERPALQGESKAVLSLSVLRINLHIAVDLAVALDRHMHGQISAGSTAAATDVERVRACRIGVDRRVIDDNVAVVVRQRVPVCVVRIVKRQRHVV